MLRALLFLMIFLVDVKITLANKPVPKDVSLTKTETKIELPRSQPVQSKRIKAPDRKRLVMQLDTETNEEKLQRKRRQAPADQRNINDEVDSGFFSGSKELSSRDPSSESGEDESKIDKVMNDVKQSFRQKVRIHFESLKKFLFN